MRGICYHDFSTTTYRHASLELQYVIYMFWFGGISGLQCFTSGTGIIIGRSPLETFQSVWRYIQTKRHGQYHRQFVGGITVPHCSAPDSVSDFF